MTSTTTASGVRFGDDGSGVGLGFGGGGALGLGFRLLAGDLGGGDDDASGRGHRGLDSLRRHGDHDRREILGSLSMIFNNAIACSTAALTLALVFALGRDPARALLGEGRHVGYR